MIHREHKHCRVCGRRMVWRGRWRANWDDVRYCSKACRRSGLTQKDRELTSAMLALLEKRQAKAGIRPEDVVAMVAGENAGGRSQPLLRAARNAARRLYNLGVVDILQRGRSVDPSTAKGSFTVRLKSPG